MPISSWLPTLWVQLPLFTFGVYLWHPWYVETFWFVSIISILGCDCLKSIAIQDTGIKQGIPNRNLKPVFGDASMFSPQFCYPAICILFCGDPINEVQKLCNTISVWFNLMVLHHYDAYSLWLTSNLYVIYRFVHDLFSYQMSLALLE